MPKSPAPPRRPKRPEIPPALTVAGIDIDTVGPDSLQEGDSDLVPAWDPDYILEPDVMEPLVLAANLDVPIMLVGPMGAGKTTSIEALAALIGQPCLRITFNGDVRAADLVGSKEVFQTDQGPYTEWQDGLIPRALDRQWWVILDEYDACPSKITFVLQSLLEPGHPLTLTRGNKIMRAPSGSRFRIFATSNTVGGGEETGLFTGTVQINKSHLSRFAGVRVGYMAREREEIVLQGKFPQANPAMIKKVVSVAVEVRNAFGIGSCSVPIALRQTILWVRAAERLIQGCSFQPITAYQRGLAFAVGSLMDPRDRQFVQGVAQRVFGGPGW